MPLPGAKLTPFGGRLLVERVTVLGWSVPPTSGGCWSGASTARCGWPSWSWPADPSLPSALFHVAAPW
jgi:hypothetical protein